MLLEHHGNLHEINNVKLILRSVKTDFHYKCCMKGYTFEFLLLLNHR